MTSVWSRRWWDVVVAALASNSVIFGVLFTSNDHPGWALAAGFVPAALLGIGLLALRRWRSLATILIIAGGALASIAWWVLYTIALAMVIVVGGFQIGRLGFAAKSTWRIGAQSGLTRGPLASTLDRLSRRHQVGGS